jgi:hypothetical protein
MFYEPEAFIALFVVFEFGSIGCSRNQSDPKHDFENDLRHRSPPFGLITSAKFSH